MAHERAPNPTVDRDGNAAAPNGTSTGPRRSGVQLLGGLTAAFGAWALLGVAWAPAAEAFAWIGGWGGLEADYGPAGRFALAVCGGALLGWGLTMWGLGRAWRRPDPAALSTTLRWAAILWFVTDSAGSIAAGAWPNTLTNTSFLALALWVTRGERAAADSAQSIADRRSSTRSRSSAIPAPAAR